MIAHADMIIVMETANWHALAKLAPEAMSKTVMLGAVAPDSGPRGEEISDPSCKPPGDMRHIALAIEQCIDNIAIQYRAGTSSQGVPAHVNLT